MAGAALGARVACAAGATLGLKQCLGGTGAEGRRSVRGPDRGGTRSSENRWSSAGSRDSPGSQDSQRCSQQGCWKREQTWKLEWCQELRQGCTAVVSSARDWHSEGSPSGDESSV